MEEREREIQIKNCRGTSESRARKRTCIHGEITRSSPIQRTTSSSTHLHLELEKKGGKQEEREAAALAHKISYPNDPRPNLEGSLHLYLRPKAAYGDFP